MIKFDRGGVDTKIFAANPEDEAVNQIFALAHGENYLGNKIRVMPDMHAGKGCTIGTTIVLTDKVTPNLVGVDIGCGMLTTKLDIRAEDIDFKLLDQMIYDTIPSGFNVHKEPVSKFDFRDLKCFDEIKHKRVLQSIGTLGGGNHFIEVAEGETGVYLIIHSGSRNLGTTVCDYYQNKAIDRLINDDDKAELISRLKAQGKKREIAKELKKRRYKISQLDRDLAILTGDDMNDYLNDMRITQQYAVTNREIMAKLIVDACEFKTLGSMETIHNYIDFDRMILRKGAIAAEENQELLIPMNMRDGSLLCVGKGNEDWNYSAPHGAGRLMSRSKAKKTLDMGLFKKTMENVYTSSVSEKTLDEAPEAYKSKEEILEQIGDTVQVIDTLVPRYNFKAQ